MYKKKACYVDPGYESKGICELWNSQNGVGLLTTLELKDFFKGDAVIQVKFNFHVDLKKILTE